ncbi:MAG TPA: DUF4870 domain-containing protein [Clostridia bacterium]|jgi:uncharacterized membrane protein|nr:DUF4870 domain-containing protein [Clostridia bacterium]
MAYCAKCGSQLNEGDKACGNCGEPVPGANRAPETTSSNDMWMGILAYLGVLALVPYLVKDQSAFVRSHAIRGINLLILEVIAWVAVGVFSWVPILDGILSTVVGLASFVFSLIGIINVANKEDKDLPVIGSIRLIKG